MRHDPSTRELRANPSGPAWQQFLYLRKKVVTAGRAYEASAGADAATRKALKKVYDANEGAFADTVTTYQLSLDYSKAADELSTFLIHHHAHAYLRETVAEVSEALSLLATEIKKIGKSWIDNLLPWFFDRFFETRANAKAPEMKKEYKALCDLQDDLDLLRMYLQSNQQFSVYKHTAREVLERARAFALGPPWEKLPELWRYVKDDVVITFHRLPWNALQKEGEVLQHCIGEKVNFARTGKKVYFTARSPKRQEDVTLGPKNTRFTCSVDVANKRWEEARGFENGELNEDEVAALVGFDEALHSDAQLFAKAFAPPLYAKLTQESMTPIEKHVPDGVALEPGFNVQTFYEYLDETYSTERDVLARYMNREDASDNAVALVEATWTAGIMPAEALEALTEVNERVAARRKLRQESDDAHGITQRDPRDLTHDELLLGVLAAVPIQPHVAAARTGDNSVVFNAHWEQASGTVEWTGQYDCEQDVLRYRWWYTEYGDSPHSNDYVVVSKARTGERMVEDWCAAYVVRGMREAYVAVDKSEEG